MTSAHACPTVYGETGTGTRIRQEERRTDLRDGQALRAGDGVVAAVDREAGHLQRGRELRGADLVVVVVRAREPVQRCGDQLVVLPQRDAPPPEHVREHRARHGEARRGEERPLVQAEERAQRAPQDEAVDVSAEERAREEVAALEEVPRVRERDEALQRAGVAFLSCVLREDVCPERKSWVLRYEFSGAHGGTSHMRIWGGTCSPKPYILHAGKVADIQSTTCLMSSDEPAYEARIGISHQLLGPPGHAEDHPSAYLHDTAVA